MQLCQATLESSLLDLRAMHREDGPSLSMGEQLCGLLQPKVLPIVSHVCVPWIGARPGAHGLAGSFLHGLELSPVLIDIDRCTDGSGLLHGCSLWSLCRDHVR